MDEHLHMRFDCPTNLSFRTANRSLNHIPAVRNLYHNAHLNLEVHNIIRDPFYGIVHVVSISGY